MKDESVNTFMTPILVTHGTKDRITDYETSRKFIEDVKSTDKEFISFENYFHELHNEPKELKKPVYELYVSWIKKRAAKL
jgi:acylglycerol lipase